METDGEAFAGTYVITCDSQPHSLRVEGEHSGGDFAANFLSAMQAHD